MTLSNNPRLILATLREGDYAHAGGAEAIDITINHAADKLPNVDALRVLDAGCGLGGTAAYIQKKLSAQYCGVDIDKNAIEHANKHYPTIEFHLADVLDIKNITTKPFHLIYMFNVFYALSQQLACLKALREVSEPGALLVIFDYIALNENEKITIKDLAGKDMNIISLLKLKAYLADSNWEVLDVMNLDNEYKIWYESFIVKLKQSKQVLLTHFTEDAYDTVLATFSALLDQIKSKLIGGTAVYARARV